MNRKVDVLGRRVLLDAWFKVEEATVSFERLDGTMSGPVRRLDLVRGEAVAAILVNRARGTVILVRQFRYATLEREGWLTEVVAGLVDEGETPDEAVRREVLEETGYRVSRLDRIYRFYPTPGITSERIVLYCAETAGAEPEAEGGGLADEHEDIEIVELPFAEAFARLDRGEIADGKTIIALSWLRQKLQAP